MALTLVDGLSTDARARLTAATTYRVPCGPSLLPYKPHPKQQALLILERREVLYGGAAGGGKSDALLMGALQYACVPGYAAAIFRETVPQLYGDDGLVPRSKDWLVGKPGVHWGEQRRLFTFASGATLRFGFIQNDGDGRLYQGHAFQYAGFDELTHWKTPKDYLFVGFSRVRKPALNCSGCAVPLKHLGGNDYRHLTAADAEDLRAIDPEGYQELLRARPCNNPRWSEDLPTCPGCNMSKAHVPLRTRAGTNPGGKGHGWVKARFQLKGRGRSVSGVRTKDRVFLPARIGDNPSLDRLGYVSGLSHLQIVEREQMLSGDWEIREDGRMFQRAWMVGDAA